jgi:L-ascorbate metabolism protein UlaG (beta-lactamase superfamily)
MRLVPILMLAAAAIIPAHAQETKKYESDSFDVGGGRNLRISFFGHASLMLETGDAVIYVDPVRQYADFSALPKADLILVTHEHGDHLDPAAIAQVKKADTRIVLNAASRSKLGEGKALGYGESLSLGSLTVTAMPAYNLSPDRLQFHPKGRDNGYILAIGNKRIYIAGDTEDTPEMRALTGIDIAFLPMNLPYTMTPAQVASAAKAFRPAILYPYHFGDTDPKKLAELLKGETGIEVRIRRLS